MMDIARSPALAEVAGLPNLKLRRLKCEIPLLSQGNLGFGCGGVWLLP